MRRATTAGLIIGAALAIVLVASRGFGVAEYLLVVAIVVVAGIGPFAFGVVIQLVWKHETVPLAIPWAFAILLGFIGYAVPQLGGLTLLASKPVSVLMTVALGGAFAELGIASAAAILHRRVEHDAASPES